MDISLLHERDRDIDICHCTVYVHTVFTAELRHYLSGAISILDMQCNIYIVFFTEFTAGDVCLLDDGKQCMPV